MEMHSRESSQQINQSSTTCVRIDAHWAHYAKLAAVKHERTLKSLLEEFIDEGLRRLEVGDVSNE